MNLIGFYTLLKREISRFIRIMMQSVMAPVITTSLYFVVFGSTLGPRISSIQGIDYIQYIVPGLIMMSIITNAFMNSSTSIFIAKFQGSIIDILVSPLSYFEITLAYAISSVIRALTVGLIILFVAIAFTSIPIYNVFYVIFFSTLVAFTFAILGIITGIWANNFDKLSLLPTFLITPLSFLGGVFYSIRMLPEFWQKVSMFNPFLYMISGLRYGFFEQSDINPLVSFYIIMIMLFAFSLIAFWMFKTGYRIKK